MRSISSINDSGKKFKKIDSTRCYEDRLEREVEVQQHFCRTKGRITKEDRKPNESTNDKKQIGQIRLIEYLARKL